jgi:hypothetical protein
MIASSGKVMGKSGQSAGQFGFCSSRETSERIVSYLRSIYPTKTAECVAADTNISAATVRKWFGRESTPNGFAVFRLIGAYGPEFLVAVFPSAPAWLSAAHQSEKAARLQRQMDALKAEMEAL